MTQQNNIVFGQDVDGNAAVIGVAGTDSDEIRVMSQDIEMLMKNVTIELKKANMYMSIILGKTVHDNDVATIDTL